MSIVYIAIGSNIDPETNIPAAIQLLKAKVRVVALSMFYHTDPVGCPEAPAFINGVIRVKTDISPRELKFDVLRCIEESLGRVRTQDKYAPRTIDLDIIVYGEVVMAEPGITIPDPDIFTRAFIAAPLAELDPKLIPPGSGKCVSDVAASLRDDSMRPMEAFTAALRKELDNEPG